MTRVHYRFDLDKTYLATPFERKLALLKVAFEPPEAKRTLPGMAALVGSLKRHPGPAVGGVTLTFLSASPRFMRPQIERKLELDAVAADRVILKDTWGLLRERRLRELVDSVIYKLGELVVLGREVRPPEVEILVGDDWETDPLIYTFYAELRAGRLPEGAFASLFARFPSAPEVERRLEEAANELLGDPTVRGIYIRRERKRGADFYAAFGGRVHFYDDAFQLALLLFDEGLLAAAGVEAVVAELRRRRWRRTAFRFSWESLVRSHRFARFRELRRLLERLAVLPAEPWWRRLRPSPPPRPEAPPDWPRIFALYERR